MSNHTRRAFLEQCVVGLGSLRLVVDVRGEPGRSGASGDRGNSLPEQFLAGVQSGDLQLVRSLAEQHPDLISARDAQGRTAFALAYLTRHPEIGVFLRDGGYQPDMHESALSLDWERFEKLADEAPDSLNAGHPIGGNAMYAAALGGAGDQIWRVYSNGGNPDPRRGSDQRPALIGALEHPDINTAETCAAMLLGNGASPNPTPQQHATPLHVAAARGSLAIVEMLIRKGADLNAKDQNGRKAIEVAERHSHKDVVTMLQHHESIPRDHSTSRLAYDVNGDPFQPADLKAFSVQSRNRLVGAAHFNLQQVQETVERHPELAKAIATTSEVSVEACAHTGNLPIVEYLLEKGAPYSLPTAVMRNDVHRVKALLREDPKRIHERGPHDFALLWYPVIGRGLIELAQILIQAGAKIEHQHYLGTTALHWAVRGGQRDMVQFFIENGADVNRVGRKFDSKGETPLQTAQKFDRDEIAKMLRAHGANA